LRDKNCYSINRMPVNADRADLLLRRPGVPPNQIQAMHRSTRHALAGAAALFVSLASTAAAQISTSDRAVAAPATRVIPRAVWGYFRFAGEFGGDRLVQFQYTDGSNANVNAGRGITFVGGLVTHVHATSAGSLDAQFGGGIKYQTVPEASNQNAHWLRVPLDASLAWRSKSGFGAGAGATMHVLNSFSASGAVANESISFDPAIGPVAFVEYGKSAWQIDLRYTSLQYTAGSGGGALSASSLGVGVTWQFARERRIGSEKTR
jgi:hypothetical protein